ncbi:MAG: LytTR family DNA-binding domain-containing protein [Bacteroidota bacterium]
MRLPAYYNLRIILILLPILMGFSTLVGTPHNLNEWILYEKFFLNLFVGSSMWLWYLLVIIRLDQSMPWESTNHKKRWLKQLGISLPVGAIIMIGTLSIRNYIINWDWSPRLALYTDLPTALILSLGIQYLHQQWYLKGRKQISIPRSELPPPPTASSSVPATAPLSIRTGSVTLRIRPEEIALIYREDQLNYLYQFEGTRHRLELSLTALEGQLSANTFFRVNRQCLINRQAIQAYEVLPTRQISISLSPPLSHKPLLNKNRSAAFKKWLLADDSPPEKEVSGS